MTQNEGGEQDSGRPAKAVGILGFPEVEVLDLCGPYEVFSVARLDEDRRREEASPFRVWIVAERTDPVTATGGLRFLPDYTLAQCPPMDVLVVPGGWGVRREVRNTGLIEWIRERAAQTELVTSVCTGSMLLAQAGLLNGRRATTHWRALDMFRTYFPEVVVEDALHVVEDGAIITAAGISAGIDMALRVVGRLFGETVRRATARHMEYPYSLDNKRRI